MTEKFQGLASLDGPRWFFTYGGIKFDVPFTRQVIELGPEYSAFFSWITSLIFIILTVFIFPRLKPSDPKTIKSIAFWHYFGLFIFSLISFLAAAYIIFVRDEWSLSNVDSYYCSPGPDWYRVLSLSFTLSKYWEWLDTALLIWNGKSIQQIGFLHYYHHMTTVWVFSLTANFPGCDKLGLFMNGFVHTLMYYHYAFRLPKMFRPLITAAQIVQLAFGTLVWGWNYEHCAEFKGLADEQPLMYWSLWAFVPVFLAFFIRFFWQTYVSPPAEPTAKNVTTTNTITTTTTTTNTVGNAAVTQEANNGQKAKVE
jgi:hypothetical protein